MDVISMGALLGTATLMLPMPPDPERCFRIDGATQDVTVTADAPILGRGNTIILHPGEIIEIEFRDGAWWPCSHPGGIS